MGDTTHTEGSHSDRCAADQSADNGGGRGSGSVVDVDDDDDDDDDACKCDGGGDGEEGWRKFGTENDDVGTTTMDEVRTRMKVPARRPVVVDGRRRALIAPPVNAFPLFVAMPLLFLTSRVRNVGNVQYNVLSYKTSNVLNISTSDQSKNTLRSLRRADIIMTSLKYYKLRCYLVCQHSRMFGPIFVRVPMWVSKYVTKLSDAGVRKPDPLFFHPQASLAQKKS